MTDKEELLEMALINFENAVTMMPVLKQHPIFQLALGQLREALEEPVEAG